MVDFPLSVVPGASSIARLILFAVAVSISPLHAQAETRNAWVRPDFLTSAVAEGQPRFGLSSPVFDRNGNFTLSGLLGVGTDNPQRGVHLQGPNAVFRMDRDRNSAAFLIVRTGSGNFSQILKSYVVGVDASGVDNGSFVINDLGAATSGAGTRRVTISNSGLFGINQPFPGATLDVDNTDNTPVILGLRDNGVPLFVFDTAGSAAATGNFTLLTPAGQSADLWAPNLGNGPFDALRLITNGAGAVIQVDADDDNRNNLSSLIIFDGLDPLAAMSRNGDLFVRGTVGENTNFDLAESFWKADSSIEPGDVVRVDSDFPVAARLTTSAHDRAVLGVASAAPGFLLGAGAFSAGDLRAAWGDAVADLFELQRAQLEQEVFRAVPDLEQGLAQARRAEASRPTRAANALEAGGLASSAAPELRVAEVSGMIEREALRLFFDRHFVKIALAGRVPVKVDAAYGRIEVGDLLVSSPTPGHAMRSDEPPPGTVLGKALQAQDGGSGTILMLVMPR